MAPDTHLPPGDLFPCRTLSRSAGEGVEGETGSVSVFYNPVSTPSLLIVLHDSFQAEKIFASSFSKVGHFAIIYGCLPKSRGGRFPAHCRFRQAITKALLHVIIRPYRHAHFLSSSLGNFPVVLFQNL